MSGIARAPVSPYEPVLVEIDAPSQELKKPTVYDALHSDLSRHISDVWTRAKFAKTEITERLLKCERQRRGVYDSDKLIEIQKTGGSDIFLRITDIKCRAAFSWIRDVMLGQAKRIFDLAPSEEPDMPPEISSGIVDLVRQEMAEFVQAGGLVHPEAFRVRMEQVHDEIMNRMRDEASEAAGRMSKKIEDQLHEGRFEFALKQFIDDFVTYPTAFMKGPVVKRKKR